MLVIVPEEHNDVYWIYCGGLSIFTLIGDVYKRQVPGRYFINGQEVVARVLLLMHGFLQGSVGVVRILAAVCAAVDRLSLIHIYLR